MRKIITTLFFGLLFVDCTAFAGDTFEMRVTASVLGVCKISGTQDIHFTSLDPSLAVNSVAQGSVSFMCTRGVDYRVTTDRGQNYDVATQRRRMKGGDTWFLPYVLASETYSGVGQGFNQPVVLNISATITGSDYKDLPAMQFADLLRLTLEP